MSDLTESQWRDIEKAAFNVNGIHPPDGRCLADRAYTRRVIELGELKNIIKKSRRTNDQNALLWSLYTDALRLGGETLGGWTTDDVHEYMLGEHFGWTEHKALGRTRLKPNRRSSRLTKLEFADFVEFVVRRFAEHGIVLELPGEVAA